MCMYIYVYICIYTHTYTCMCVYCISLVKVQPLLTQWEQFVQQWCNLATMESRLECTYVNKDEFTVLDNRGGRCCWVSMCTVWPLHSKWLSEYSNKSTSDFALSLNITPWKIFGWFRRLQLWATGNWQLHHDNVPLMHHTLCSFFVKHQTTQVT